VYVRPFARRFAAHYHLSFFFDYTFDIFFDGTRKACLFLRFAENHHADHYFCRDRG